MSFNHLLLSAPAARFSSSAIHVPTTDSLVAFGSGKLIALWDAAEETGVEQLLVGHEGEVSVVKAMEGGGWVSGDTKGGVRVWTRREGDWATIASAQAHATTISALAIHLIPDGESLVLTGATDSSIKLWRLRQQNPEDQASELKLIQEVQLGGRLSLDAAFRCLDGENLLLALATTDSKISLYPYRYLTRSANFTLFLHNFSPSKIIQIPTKPLSIPGHTDWVRSLSFVSDPSSDTLLASGSQDGYIRLWRLSPSSKQPNGQTEKDATLGESDNHREGLESPTPNEAEKKFDPLAALDALEDSLPSAAPRGSQKVEMRRYPLAFSSGKQWDITAEAVLVGHEAWVTNVLFLPPSSASSGLRLLSTSADRSAIMWQPEKEGGLWLTSSRFGELAASTNLGFFNALYLSLKGGEERVLASGWSGGWHVWRRDEAKEGEEWEQCVAPTGHFGAVTGLEWDREGEYLLTCSADETSRLWGVWRRPSSSSTSIRETWHEICRPQVHGHPLSAITFTGPSNRRTCFASAAEEKVVRVFEATEAFVGSVSGDRGMGSVKVELVGGKGKAMVPPLGLSQRVVGDMEDGEEEEEGKQGDGVARPLVEEKLLRGTLWPEIEKLYGPPSELLTLHSSPDGTILATSAVATSVPHAAIRLFTTTNYRPLGKPLEFHKLSVTSLRFSWGGKELASVGRDRGWAVWREQGEEVGWELVQGKEAAHGRVVFDVAWAWGDGLFATASRDKTVKIWCRNSPEESERWVLSATIKVEDGATSVAFPGFDWEGGHFLAVGLANGRILLYTSSRPTPDDPFKWTLHAISQSFTAYHAGPVLKLSFSPRRVGDHPNVVRLASSGEDRTVRIVDLTVS